MKHSFIFLLFVLFFTASECATALSKEIPLLFSAGSGAMDGTVIIAETKGYFLEKGINGKVIKFSKGKIAFDKYLSGEIDIATANIISIVLTDLDLSKHRIIGTLAYTDNQTKIIARKSRGIKTPSDLRGKKIATVRATTAHFFIDKFLTLNNIPCNETQIIFMSKKQLPQAIASGKVDAVCQHGMPIENAKKALKNDWVIFQDGSIHRKPVSLVVSKMWLDEKPKQVKDMLKAILKAEQFIQTNTDESIRIIAKVKGYPFDVMNEAIRGEIKYNLSMKQYLYMLLENMEQWAIDNNLVKRKKPRNYIDFLDFGPLEAVAPEKVTIIR
ncbi:MAG: ABC transporter substrate-binding protein [Desulfobacterales bacterium]|nr:ABC transporter substrate-binding protein [Desulfobacterales bacterium]